jgi:SAM-dependent methyltransferase
MAPEYGRRADEDTELLDEQVAFYRRRAPEYDEWWQRRGPYDRGPEAAARWEAEVREVENALEEFGVAGDVLELAGGTGWWTERLAKVATQLTVVDAAPEALELNQRRVGRRDVRYLTRDLFDWTPDGAHLHDVVFFSFWLSHVPSHRFEGFWAMVGRCLAPHGRVFFIDNRDGPTAPVPDPYVFDRVPGLQRRRLSDGSEHRVVKVFYDRPQLTDLLAAIGWVADVRETVSAFVFGSATPARSPGVDPVMPC